MRGQKTYPNSNISRGFSFAEVLIGVSLLTILSSIAVPSLTTFRNRWELTSASQQVAFELSRCHTQAIGQNVTARFRLLDSQHYVVERSTNGGGSFEPYTAVGVLPQSVSATVGTTGWPVFNRMGIAAADTMIIVSSEQGTKLVRANVLGRVTIQ